MPTVNCPYFALWMTSLFDKTIKMILPQVNKVHRFDNKRVSHDGDGNDDDECG